MASKRCVEVVEGCLRVGAVAPTAEFAVFASFRSRISTSRFRVPLEAAELADPVGLTGVGNRPGGMRVGLGLLSVGVGGRGVGVGVGRPG